MKHGRLLRYLTLLAALVLPVSASSQSKMLTARDLLAFDQISELAPSPDGAYLAFTRTTTEFDSNRRRSDIWLMSTSDEKVSPFTADADGGSSPRWSPDGTSIWFVSSRSGSSQVWKRALDGSAAEQVTDLPLDVANLVVSPDGQRLAFTVEVFPDCDSLQCSAERLQERDGATGSGRLYDSLFIRHWRSFNDGMRSHLFVMPAEGGELVDVTANINADVPSQPFGGPEEITFTPDGQALVFSMKDVGREEAWSVDFDLYVAPVDGSHSPRSITTEDDAWSTYPAFSPDGSRLAYLATERPGYESDRFRIIVKDWPDGPARVLAQHWDYSPNELAWSSTSEELLVTAASGGQTLLFALDATSGKARTLVDVGTVSGLVPSDDTVYFLWDDLATPPEIHSVRTGTTDPGKISAFHDQRKGELKFGEFESLTFQGWNDETVSAYVVKPVDLDETKADRYPVILLIHGGPQSSLGNHFQGVTNPHIWAGAGYATLMIDFHGSVGYGQSFTDSIRGDYGGKPYVDLMKGLDAALERYPWMDGDRLAAVGRSFAGFMVNWIAGQAPERFRCLVSHAGRLDERSAYLSTDELWFPEWDHEGTLWENPAGYETHNPIDYIQQWQTPMLIIHGGRDYRVALSQSVATFTALQRRGIESQFLYFPDEGHSVSRPQNIVQWHKVVLDWFERCL